MLNYGYMGYQAERLKSRAEQRQADAQLGELFAALGELLGALAKPARDLRRQTGPASSVTARPHQPSADGICHDRDVDLQHDNSGRECSSEPGMAPREPGACSPQRRPLAVG
jgi:hypothetical protein